MAHLTQSLRHRLRRIARNLRHTPDRALHHWRHRRALKAARRLRGPVLFVCHGNICRSPYAEHAFRRRLEGTTLDVDSAGFLQAGREPPPTACEVGITRGIELSAHRSRTLTPTLVDAAGTIIVMDSEQRERIRRLFGRRDHVLLLGDFDPEPIDTRTVIDPIDRDAEYFAAVYDRIDRCSAALAAQVNQRAMSR